MIAETGELRVTAPPRASSTALRSVTELSS
jgi:hypothetical protein